MESFIWFAPGVGIVKLANRRQHRPGAAQGGAPDAQGRRQDEGDEEGRGPKATKG